MGGEAVTKTASPYLAALISAPSTPIIGQCARDSEIRAKLLFSIQDDFACLRPRRLGTRARVPRQPRTPAQAADQPIMAEASRVGKRGTVVIPAALRRQYGIEEGTFVVAEAREGGVLIRPAVILPLEIYTRERKAQFLLSNAVNAADYAGAVATVRAMGLEPEAIPHYKPPGA